MPLSNNYSLRWTPTSAPSSNRSQRRKDRDLAYVIRKAIDEYIERHQADPD